MRRLAWLAAAAILGFGTAAFAQMPRSMPAPGGTWPGAGGYMGGPGHGGPGGMGGPGMGGWGPGGMGGMMGGGHGSGMMRGWGSWGGMTGNLLRGLGWGSAPDRGWELPMVWPGGHPPASHRRAPGGLPRP